MEASTVRSRQIRRIAWRIWSPEPFGFSSDPFNKKHGKNRPSACQWANIPREDVRGRVTTSCGLRGVDKRGNIDGYVCQRDSLIAGRHCLQLSRKVSRRTVVSHLPVI